MAKVVIHTDGACRGNPGPGGWGAILEAGDHERLLSGAEPATTNNRMELQAAIAALKALKRPCEVEIVTDSQYVRQGITEWLAQWKRRGWLTAGRRPVANADLWRELDAAASGHTVHWRWVKGHSGHPGNERADRLANEAIDRLLGDTGKGRI
ncbi:ribonuclease HI [Acidiferrobacter sp.]|uniref:ribonuclease HI n=1 Tax=Acidiferrobacter sp. TaxID=1872107 RepID=UPI002621BCB9|nr:ribonuclease HI [Acidiferrobacter sp.]